MGGHFILRDMADMKKWASFEEQMELLAQRGCVIGDRKFCLEALKRTSYYRLSAYLLPFKDGDRYTEGTTFERVHQIYEFDRKLRTLLFSAIEEIEVFFRVQVAHYHAKKYGERGYYDAVNFREHNRHGELMARLKKEVDRNKKVPYVKHHIERYDGSFPLWVAVELFSFGTLAKFYADMHSTDQKQLSKIMYPGTSYNNSVLKSWLQCLTGLRNVCAHYGRLYYRPFSTPKPPAKIEFDLKNKLFDMTYVMRSLHPKEESWNNTILPQITALIEQYEGHINLGYIGFPPDWEEKLMK